MPERPKTTRRLPWFQTRPLTVWNLLCRGGKAAGRLPHVLIYIKPAVLKMASCREHLWTQQRKIQIKKWYFFSKFSQRQGELNTQSFLLSLHWGNWMKCFFYTTKKQLLGILTYSTWGEGVRSLWSMKGDNGERGGWVEGGWRVGRGGRRRRGYRRAFRWGHLSCRPPKPITILAKSAPLWLSLSLWMHQCGVCRSGSQFIASNTASLGNGAVVKRNINNLNVCSSSTKMLFRGDQ